MMEIVAGVIGIITGFLGIIGWFNKKIEKEVQHSRNLTSTEIRSLGRSIDAVKVDVSDIYSELSRHDRKISQSDIVMIHIDDTMKNLAKAVEKLDDTLNALQISFAESRGHKD